MTCKRSIIAILVVGLMLVLVAGTIGCAKDSSTTQTEQNGDGKSQDTTTSGIRDTSSPETAMLGHWRGYWSGGDPRKTYTVDYYIGSNNTLVEVLDGTGYFYFSFTISTTREWPYGFSVESQPGNVFITKEENLEKGTSSEYSPPKDTALFLMIDIYSNGGTYDKGWIEDGSMSTDCVYIDDKQYP